MLANLLPNVDTTLRLERRAADGCRSHLPAADRCDLHLTPITAAAESRCLTPCDRLSCCFVDNGTDGTTGSEGGSGGGPADGWGGRSAVSRRGVAGRAPDGPGAGPATLRRGWVDVEAPAPEHLYARTIV